MRKWLIQTVGPWGEHAKGIRQVASPLLPLWLQMSAQLAGWPLAQSVSLCENQWNHICAAPKCGLGTSTFQAGGSVMVLSAKPWPKDSGHLAR